MKKIVTIKELEKIVAGLKAEGKKIVLANGCFDIIHVGHVRYLKDAKSRGDILVVAINDDNSTRKLKGPGRPIFNENERAELIGSYDFVDYVTIFTGLRVDEVLRRLQPHVHAKGTDYTAETVPERDVVLGYGGEIAICGDKKTHSTRDIIKEIQNL